MMKKSIVTTTGIILLTCSFISLTSDLSPDDEDFILETYINGGVSTTGLYESQAQEDAANNIATINGGLGLVGK